MKGCCSFTASFCGLLAIKAQAASVQVLNAGIKHAVAASAVATGNHDPNSLQVASDASGCEYHCCDRDPHATAAAAAAMSGESLCIPFFGVMFQFESASLGCPKTCLTGYVLRFIGILVSWCGRGDSGKVLPTVLGMETKQRCTPEEVKVSRGPSHLQALTWEDRGDLADMKGWDGHNSDGSLCLSKVMA